MNKEKLINLNMKDVILDKWKSKKGYILNNKDLEELKNIIDYYEQENNQIKEDLKETSDNVTFWNNRYKASERENQQLRDSSKNFLYKLAKKDRVLKGIKKLVRRRNKTFRTF